MRRGRRFSNERLELHMTTARIKNASTAHANVTVTFNGHDELVPFQPAANLDALLAHAKKAFDVQSNHLLSLFTEAGIELTDNQSGEDAGVLPGAVLILRQSTVRGGRGTPLTVAPELLEST